MRSLIILGCCTILLLWAPSLEATEDPACLEGTELVTKEVGPRKRKTTWCEGATPDGKTAQQGPYRAYHANGNVAIAGEYLNGQRHGTWTSFYRDGQKASEQQFHEGSPDGRLTRWYPDGKKQIEIQFRDGVMEGEQTQWWPSGKKWKTGTNLENEPAGEWKCWGPRGDQVDCADQGM